MTTYSDSDAVVVKNLIKVSFYTTMYILVQEDARK